MPVRRFQTCIPPNEPQSHMPSSRCCHTFSPITFCGGASMMRVGRGLLMSLPNEK